MEGPSERGRANEGACGRRSHLSEFEQEITEATECANHQAITLRRSLACCTVLFAARADEGCRKAWRTIPMRFFPITFGSIIALAFTLQGQAADGNRLAYLGGNDP